MASPMEMICDQVQILKIGEKFAKRRALEEMNMCVKTPFQTLAENQQKCAITLILDPILSVINGESSERCRELACDVLLQLCNSGNLADSDVELVVSSLRQRLCKTRTFEPSEEIRLKEVEILCAIVKNDCILSTKYTDFMLEIFSSTLLDDFAEVRKLSCQCIIYLEQINKECFILQCGALRMPLLQNLKHRHSAVRAIVLQTLTLVLFTDSQFFSSSSAATLAARGATIDALYGILHDDTSAVVRLELVKLVYVGMRRRIGDISFTPFLLVALSDPIECVQELAEEKWRAFGKDFCSDRGLHNGVDSLRWCELYFEPHLPCLVSEALNLCESWKQSERLSGVRLLYALCKYAGNPIGSYCDRIIVTALVLYAKGDKEVDEQMDDTLGCLALHSGPSRWLSRLHPEGVLTPASLRATSMLVGASDSEEIREHALSIIHLIGNASLAIKDQDSREWSLASVARVLDSGLEVGQLLPPPELLCLCLTLLDPQDSSASSHPCLTLLANKLQLRSVADLCVSYGKDILQQMCTVPQWEAAKSLVVLCGTRGVELVPSLVALLNGYEDNLEGQCQCLQLLNSAIQSGAPPSLLRRSISGAIIVISTATTPTDADGHDDGSLQQRACCISENVMEALFLALVPVLEWKAGHAAATVRLLGMRCLYTAVKLNPSLKFNDVLSERVVSLLDDEGNVQTRIIACYLSLHCSCVEVALRQLASRLDDVNDDVISAAARSLAAAFDDVALSLQGDSDVIDRLLDEVIRSLNGCIDSVRQTRTRRVCNEVLEKLQALRPPSDDTTFSEQTISIADQNSLT